MKENNEIKETLEGSIDRIDRKRRSFAKTGIVAPVIMTMANRPVFGATNILCGSQMASNNTSRAIVGNCVAGRSPGGWGTPRGMIIPDLAFLNLEAEGGVSGVYTYVWADNAAGSLYYGDLPGEISGGTGNKCEDFTGGSTFSDAFGVNSSSPHQIMREIFCDDSSYDEFHFCAAILNARCFNNDLMGYYPLTEQEVIALYNDRSLLSKYDPNGLFTSVREFLDSTWI